MANDEHNLELIMGGSGHGLQVSSIKRDAMSIIPGMTSGRLLCLEFVQPHRVVVIADEYSNDTTQDLNLSFSSALGDFAASIVTNTTGLRVTMTPKVLTIHAPDSLDQHSGVIDIYEAISDG